jgi:hypothetical protein
MIRSSPACSKKSGEHLSVKRTSPEDFILMLPDEEVVVRVFNNGVVFDTPNGPLKFLRWLSFAHAESTLLHFHARDLTTVQSVLSSWCSLVELQPESEAHHDLSVLLASAWSCRLDLIHILEPVLSSEDVVHRLLSYTVALSVAVISCPSAVAPGVLLPPQRQIVTLTPSSSVAILLTWGVRRLWRRS